MKVSRFQFTLGIALAFAALAFSLAVDAQAQTVNVLVDFNLTNGGGASSVVQGTDGNFYGTTNIGGKHDGTLFRVTPDGTLTTVYSFCSQAKCVDGASPFQSPILGNDGNLYGVVLSGGSDTAYPTGSGIIYKMTPGNYSVLYTFCETMPCLDGAAPTGIVQAADGNFYGTAAIGGAFNEGTFFKLTPAGKLTVLYSFCSLANCVDGSGPSSAPIQARDGNFYGTAGGGSNGHGVVYQITSTGSYQVIYNFCSISSCTDGSQPNGLVQDASGNLYGTTTEGGFGYGAIFKINSGNHYFVLHHFDETDASPFAGLIFANDGNLYGVSEGDLSGGAVFDITAAGVYTEFYVFSDCDLQGCYPVGPPFQGTNGIFYGTTGNGGSGGYGTVFSFSNGLSPLVQTVPVVGKVGSSVLILGNNLTGSSSVTFNGVEAKFTVESDTYIKATVPAGATTGTVSVVTPTGTLNSNPRFVVTK